MSDGARHPVGGESDRLSGLERDELFRVLVSSVVDYAIFMLDVGGHVATWNAGAERFKGYTAAEIIGSHFSRFYPPDDVRAGKCERELEVAVRLGRCEDEGWRIRKDGTRFWANVVITAMRDDRGALLGFAKVTRDLTIRRAEEMARLAAEERFRLLVESVQDYALLSLDSTGHITTWNRGAERIKGYAASEIIGKHFSTFYPEEDVRAGKCEHELTRTTADGRFEDEGWRVRKDGTRFWANVVISAVRDATGALTGFSKVTRDLTERRRAEEERAARLVAENANRMKDEFLAMLGHELRNPLAPIVTALELVKLRGDASHEHTVIERQVDHMMRLVDDLLDVSRITRGEIQLEHQSVDVRDVVARALEIARPLVQQRRHHVEVVVPDHPILVYGDATRLTQVITNLARNAAKFTDPGGRISVEVRQVDGRAVVEVSDNGSGIGPDLLPRVFDLFVQGGQQLDRALGGLGLGLTLVRSLVDLHGGDVEAHSDGPGRGSRFIVRLPVCEPQPMKGATTRRKLGVRVPKRILLVDDNEDARTLLADLLGVAGHDVRTASDGPGALEIVGAFQPQVALLDIGLPVMDGYELAEHLRALATAPRLVSLTGYGQKSDFDRSREAGFARHMVKPINVHDLLDVIDELR